MITPDKLGRIRRLAVPAAVAFHFSATTLMYFAGKSESLSQPFPDAATYQNQIIVGADVLKTLGIEAWFFSLLPFHVKLYSLCLAAFGRWMSLSILLFEPLNALYYVAILYFVFTLGRRIFDAKTGLLATAVIAIWPSFLVHTTQPLKDPLFIALALLFLTINSLWLKKCYSLRRALALVTLGGITECFLWIVKSDMWQVMIAVAIVTFGVLMIMMLRKRKTVWGNTVGALLLLVMSLIIPRAAMHFYQPAIGWAQTRGVALEYENANLLVPVEVPRKSFLGARMARLRQRFIITYPTANSNIDTDVEFNSTADIIRYLPRAMLIGLCAPFPKMWLARGLQSGRMIGGAETFVLYIIELMALIGLWHARRELLAWWLFLIPLIGSAGLGLVVTNVGALYRMRYVFVMLLVIMGSHGFRQTLRHFTLVRTKASGTEFQ